MAKKQNEVLIIGAGIVGVSAAIWLQRQGCRVTLIDRDEPASGTSHGNAGILAAGSVVPIPVPGLLKKAPKMLLDPNQPLFLRWSYLLNLLPFFNLYLRYANDHAVERTSNALMDLLLDCPDQHLAIAGGTTAEKYVSKGSYLFGYDNEQAFTADSYGWNIRAGKGYKYKTLNGEELAHYDQSLAGRFGFAVQCLNHGRISDPGAYVKALADDFAKNGGTILKASLTEFAIKNGRCESISTSVGSLKADKYILTTGIWSGEWNDALGITVPMESERGYHVEYINPSIRLRSPIMVAGGKFVVNSMDGRMRCAGIVEFGGLIQNPSEAPIELLKRQMAKLFPDLKYDRTEEWMGHRPSTADSLPIIGISPKADNVVLGFGHQHIGLSAGPKTGRWLAELATDTKITTDLSAYAVDRKMQPKGI